MTGAEELGVIYDAARDKFLGVHPTKGNRAGASAPGKGYLWRMALRIRGTLKEFGRYRTREEAARAVVAYLKERYGGNWERVVRARNGHRPFRVRRAGACYLADVWLSGTPVTVTPRLVRDKAGASGDGWATEADARRALDEFKARFEEAGDELDRPHLMRV